MNIEKAFLEGDIVSEVLFRLWWTNHDKTPRQILQQVRMIRLIRALFFILWGFAIAFGASKSGALAVVIFSAGAVIVVALYGAIMNEHRSDKQFVRDCLLLKELLRATPSRLSEGALKKRIHDELETLTQYLHGFSADRNKDIAMVENHCKEYEIRRDELYEVAAQFRLVSPVEDRFVRFSPPPSRESASQPA